MGQGITVDATNNNVSSNTTPLQITVHPLPDSTSASNTSYWSGGDSPSFKDFLDTINPLQHIPGVAAIYQKLTGDMPSSGANIAGGALIGGVLGLVAAVGNEVIKTQTGKDLGGNILALLSGESTTSASSIVANAEATYAPPPTNKSAYNAYMQSQQMMA